MSKTPVTIEFRAFDGISSVLNSISLKLKNVSTNFSSIEATSHKAVGGASKDIDKLQKQINNLNKPNGFNKLYNGFNDLSYPLHNLSRRITSIFKDSIKLADDFNTNIKRTASNTHMPHEDLDKFALKAELVGKSIGASMTAFSKSIYEGTKNAVHTQEGLINAAKFSIMMAKDLDIGEDVAMGSIIGLTHAFGEGEDKFENSADLLVWLKEKSGSDIHDLRAANSYGAPIASAFNLPKTDYAALVAKMSLSDIKGSVAGTAIRNLLFGTMEPKLLIDMAKRDPKFNEKLEKSGMTSDDRKEVFDTKSIDTKRAAAHVLGIDYKKIYDTKGNLQLFEYLIPKLIEAQGKVNVNIFESAIKDMFGKHGLAGITQLIKKPKEDEKDPNKKGMDIFAVREIISHFKGQAQTQFAIKQMSVGGKIDALNSKIDNFKVKLANSGLITFVIKLVDNASKFMDKLDATSPTFKKYLLHSGMIFLGLIAISSVLIFVGQTFWALSMIWSGASALIVGAVGKLATGFVFLKKAIVGVRLASLMLFISNPMFWVATATIGAIALIGYYIYKNWDMIKFHFNMICLFFKQIFKTPIEFISEIIDKSIEKVKYLFDKIMFYQNRMKNIMGLNNSRNLIKYNAIVDINNKKERDDRKNYDPEPLKENSLFNKGILGLNIPMQNAHAIEEKTNNIIDINGLSFKDILNFDKRNIPNKPPGELLLTDKNFGKKEDITTINNIENVNHETINQKENKSNGRNFYDELPSIAKLFDQKEDITTINNIENVNHEQIKPPENYSIKNPWGEQKSPEITRSIIELTIKNAPMGSTISTKSTGKNPPIVKLNQIGIQGLAYE